ncbi:hypothetical protein IAR50_002631 [Cryptococcus sp. DSM 104548]
MLSSYYASLLSALLLVAGPALGAPAPDASTVTALPSVMTGSTNAATAGSASPSSVPKASSSVAKSSSSAAVTSATPALWIEIEEFAKLHSDDANEGSGDGQKRPYGITGPNAVKFKFDGDDYTQETFKVTYYPTPSASAVPTDTEASYNPQSWTTASGTPTKVIECVATASASLTENLMLLPTPDLSTTTGGVGIKCTDAAA